MIEFDYEFVIAVPNASAMHLRGETVFFGNSLNELRDIVIANDVKYKKTLQEVHTDSSMPFVASTGDDFCYIYYDPYYDLRLAVSEGSKIEICSESDNTWTLLENPSFDEPPERYRIARLELGAKVKIVDSAGGLRGIITAKNDSKEYFVGGYWYAEDELEVEE